MRWPLNLRVNLVLASLGLFTPALAQDADLLSEEFLLFLADGIEVDGEWQDPLTLANMAQIQDVPEDELVWVSERDRSEIDQLSEVIIDGEANE